MLRIPSAAFVALSFVAPLLPAQTTPVSDSAIVKQIQGLRGLPDSERGKQTGDIALEIRSLPAGERKLSLALGLSHLSTEGDPGRDNLQAVTTTLAQALKENPVPANKKTGAPASPYMELAELVRYEGMTAEVADPQLKQAADILAANDAEIQKLDFTLKDLHGKKWTLSELRGKVVVVNFWATWCPPCRKELPDLDAIYTHFQSQGLVVLALTDEDMAKVGALFSGHLPAFPVLLDTGHKVGAEFHVEGLPRTFVFDREGKLVAQSMDMRTQRQFLGMLAQAGLKL
jgi:thiol-disulfide isomerase/thioredoxin